MWPSYNGNWQSVVDLALYRLMVGLDELVLLVIEMANRSGLGPGAYAYS